MKCKACEPSNPLGLRSAVFKDHSVHPADAAVLQSRAESNRPIHSEDVQKHSREHHDGQQE